VMVTAPGSPPHSATRLASSTPAHLAQALLARIQSTCASSLLPIPQVARRALLYPFRSSDPALSRSPFCVGQPPHAAQARTAELYRRARIEELTP